MRVLAQHSLTVLALHHAAGLIGLAGTALMTWLLVRGTGKKPIESCIGDPAPRLRRYVRRTSGFLPLPPGKP